MKNTLTIGRNIGAAIGAAAFMAFGILPGFYFGSMGTLMVLSSLAGGPVAAGTLVKLAVSIGIFLGIFCAAAVSIVIGALMGTAVGYVTGLITTPVSEKTKAKAQA